jgi:hypothetical protein
LQLQCLGRCALARLWLRQVAHYARFHSYYAKVLLLLLLLLLAVAMLGEVCSGASVAAAGVSNAKKLPIVSPSSTTPSLSQPDFFFRVVSAAASA